MDNKNKIFSLLVFISTIIFVLTMVPFPNNLLDEYEWLIKFAIFPIIIFGISIYCYISNKKNKIKFISTIFPITSYIAASFFNLAILEFRKSSENWINSLNIYIYLGILFTIVSFIVILSKTNNCNEKIYKRFSLIIFGLLLLQIIYCLCKTMVLKQDDLGNCSSKFIIILFIISLFQMILFNFSFFISKKSRKNEQHLDEITLKYTNYKNEYLLNLYNYSQKELEKLGYSFANGGSETIKEKIVEVERKIAVPVDRIVEIEKIIEVPAEVEKIVEVPVEKIVEIEKIVEVPIEVEKTSTIEIVAPIKAKPISLTSKEKKIIEPTVGELAQYITENFSDVNIIYGKTDGNYKVYRKKKLMCIVQSSSKDYKIIFQRKPISVAKLLIKYPNSIIKATSPKGEQWFRAVNKGNILEDDLKTIIKFSHKYLVDAEIKEQAKKEKAKEKLKAKKLAEKAKLKAKRDAQKAKEKLKAQKIKEQNKLNSSKKKKS